MQSIDREDLFHTEKIKLTEWNHSASVQTGDGLRRFSSKSTQYIFGIAVFGSDIIL